MPQELIDKNQFTNWLQTILLIFAMATILLVTGYALFGVWGLIASIILLAFGVVLSRRMTPTMILRAYNAHPIPPESSPHLFALFSQICRKANLSPAPTLFYIPSRLPNAFAVGRGTQASVALTDGLLRILTPREIAGVLAHEVSHIVNRDISVLGLADSITRTTSTLARIGLMMMFFSIGSFLFGPGGLRFILIGLLLLAAPVFVVILQLTVSRTREFDADQGAAELTGDPHGLAMALQKLDPPKPVSMLEKILRPGRHRKEPAMLRTHPPTAERVKKLMELVEIQKSREEKTPEIVFLDEGELDSFLTKEHQAVERKPGYHILSGLWH